MDYQVGLVQRLPDGAALVDRADTVIADVRARGAHVGWVRVAFTDAEFDAIPRTSVMARLATPDRRAELHVDSPNSRLHPDLDARPDDIAVRKTRVGAFTTTDLGDQLRGRGIDTIVLAGISTSGVVLSTVREAMDRDYRIAVLADACADPQPELHAFLIEKIFPRYASVLDTDALAQVWN